MLGTTMPKFRQDHRSAPSCENPMARASPTRFVKHVCVLAIASATSAGCTDDLRNLTASLGGASAGERGTVRVLCINNTEARAVFTFGTFDQTDRLSVPSFQQFGLDASEDVLNSDTESEILEFPCGRVFAVGSPRLLEFIDANASDADTIAAAMVEGIDFYDTSTDDATEPPLLGSAPPFEALLGIDFPCNSLLILYLEPAVGAADPFRIDFQLIPSESTR